MRGKMKRGFKRLTMVWLVGLAVVAAQIPAGVTAANSATAPLVFDGNCDYQTHIQDVGWQDWKTKKETSGTTGRSLRLEGITITMSHVANLGVTYQTHVQNEGWQNWVSEGEVAGTTGKSLRLEAIRIKLTGTEADNYDIYYQVHVQNTGWMDWVKNGELAGTEGQSYRLEAIRMVVLPKGSPAPENQKAAKNVILMIADGCGSNQILATDYYTNGAAGTQVYESFPTKLNMSTYSYGEPGTEDDKLSLYDPATIWGSFNLLKNYPTDSAAAATAMATGTKSYNAAIGIDQDQKKMGNITENFKEQGKSTGVISTVEFSNATPAGFVAHNASRENYSELANEMLRDSATDVIMGTGNPLYDDDGKKRDTLDDSYYNYVGGKETWEALLNGTLGNDANNDGNFDKWNLIQTKDEFESLQSGSTPGRVLGVPEVYTTLQLNRSGEKTADPYVVEQNKNVPTLATMSRGALNVLDNNSNGFFLMIEGGAVDWAGHGNLSGRLIEEETDFNDAVQAVCNWVETNSSWSETLVIVTGDHETGYLTGSSGVYGEVVNNGKQHLPTMAWNSTYHTNQLIPFFAKGAGAELFNGYADGSDPVKGAYLDNTEIVLGLRDLLDNDK